MRRQRWLHGHVDPQSRGGLQLGFLWGTMANTLPSTFMDKVPLSNPMGLQALAEQAPRFAMKAGDLPSVRKKAHRKPNKLPDATDQLKAPKLGAPPMDPEPQAEPQIG